MNLGSLAVLSSKEAKKIAHLLRESVGSDEALELAESIDPQGSFINRLTDLLIANYVASPEAVASHIVDMVFDVLNQSNMAEARTAETDWFVLRVKEAMLA